MELSRHLGQIYKHVNQGYQENSVAYHYLGCRNPTVLLKYILLKKKNWSFYFGPRFAACSAAYYYN